MQQTIHEQQIRCPHPILVGIFTYISGYVLTDGASAYHRCTASSPQSHIFPLDLQHCQRYFWVGPLLLQLGDCSGCLFGRGYTVWTVGIWSEEAACGGHAQRMVTSIMVKSTMLRLTLPSSSSSKYLRAVNTAVNADLNVYRVFVRLDHPVSQRDCRSTLLFTPACDSQIRDGSFNFWGGLDFFNICLSH